MPPSETRPQPMRIDSPILRIALWITSLLPIALGLGGMVYMFYMLWGTHSIWAVIPISLMVVGMGLVPLQLARKLASSVIIESRTRLVVGTQAHSIDGSERCELKRWPNLTFVQLTLSGGVEVLFFPEFEAYYDIKREGAVTWWRDVVNARPE